MERTLCVKKTTVMSSQESDARIKAQARYIEELEQELRIIRRQLQQFQGRQMDEIAERRRAAIQFYREEYERKHGPMPPYTGTEAEGFEVLN